jgi:YD repeat-containing protein
LTQYQYDLRGNLVSASASGQTAQYGYDAQNRLVNTSLPDGMNIINVYDASGHRVQQRIDFQVTNYRFNESGLTQFKIFCRESLRANFR